MWLRILIVLSGGVISGYLVFSDNLIFIALEEYLAVKET
jgi:hypothetical protein